MPAKRETLLCRYHCDPMDRVADCAPLNQESIQRFYRQSRLATEIQGAVQHSVFQHDEQLLAQQRREAGGVDSRLLATDLQRSVLYGVGAGQRQQVAYSPYGHRSPEGGLISLLGFNGERRDQVTGHYLLGNGYRAFNPVLMRFNSPDSLSPFGKGGLNAYVYCVGDPVNRVDPTGHSPLLVSLGKYLQRAAASLPVNASPKLANNPDRVLGALSSSAGNVSKTGPAGSIVKSSVSGVPNDASTLEALDLASPSQLLSKSGQQARDIEKLGGLFDAKKQAFDQLHSTQKELSTLERFVASSKDYNPAEIPAQPAFIANAKAKSVFSKATSELKYGMEVHFLKYPLHRKNAVANARWAVRRDSN